MSPMVIEILSNSVSLFSAALGVTWPFQIRILSGGYSGNQYGERNSARFYA